MRNTLVSTGELKIRPPVSGRKITCAGVSEGSERRHAVGGRQIHAARDAVDFRFVPGDGKHQRRIQQRIEIESAVGVLPEIIAGKDDPLTDGLLESGVVLVAPSGLERRLAVGSERRSSASPPTPVELDRIRFSLYGVSSVCE